MKFEDVKIGMRVRYIHEDTDDDKATGWYPPIGTCGVVMDMEKKPGFAPTIRVAWDSGVESGNWWCCPEDVEPVPAIDYKIIAVDFDGTLCENNWPEIGAPNYDLIRYLRTTQLEGNKIILWTCRSGDRLCEALNWCEIHGLIFDAVNDNIREAVDMFGGDSRKVFAHEYIDDSACTKFKLPYVAEKKEEDEPNIRHIRRLVSTKMFHDIIRNCTVLRRVYDDGSCEEECI